MLQHVLWGVTFVTLWLTIVWLNFLHAEKPRKRVTGAPRITFAIPAFNEESSIVKTVESLLGTDYPKGKKEILVVDDGSMDRTGQVVRRFMRENPKAPVMLLRKKNGGKASALNLALRRATGELFSVVDADSRVGRDSVKRSLAYFGDETGAVISRVRVDEPKGFLERLQRFEYIMSSMTRRIMANFGTLAITPGVLSMYRSCVLRDVGGFSEDAANTEDLEIALRLKSRGYAVEMAHDSVTYTKVPPSIGGLWKQRIRWARGYIYNHWKYRGMFFNSRHGLFGTFQLPVNVLAVVLLVVNIGIIWADVFDRVFEFVFRSLTIPDYLWVQLTNWPSVKEFVLARNVQVTVPLVMVLVLGVYLMVFAHRLFRERVRNHVTPAVSYVLFMPWFMALNWVSSIAQEIGRAKRKW